MDDWPRTRYLNPHDSAVWKPIDEQDESIPLIGGKILMAMWLKPHHLDGASYRSFKTNATWRARLIEKFEQFPHQITQFMRDWVLKWGTRTGAIDIDDEPLNTRTDHPAYGAADINHDKGEHKENPTYILENLPRRTGAKLQLGAPGTSRTAWGVLFQEGFHIHRGLFALLMFYTIWSLAIGAWLLSTYGLNLASSGVPATGLCTWLLSFISLTLTVWFKWAENSH
jgi:hypothetical protein